MPPLPLPNPSAVMKQGTTKRVPNRIGVVEMVYHQITDQGIRSVDSRYSRELVSEEQYYSHTERLTEEWKPINKGWIDQVGMLILKNEEGKFNVIPTEEEKQAMAKRIVEVGWALEPEPTRTMLSPTLAIIPFALVHPGESIRFVPADFASLRFRSRYGEVKCTPTIFPA